MNSDTDRPAQMTSRKNLTPPSPTKADAVIEGVKAGLSGPVGILGALLKTPLEKRRDEWMRAVEEALLELQGRVDNFSIDSLSENELFISTIVQAAIGAQRTHAEEKRMALRNVVLNTAISPDLDATKVEILLGLLESLTPWHIKILDLFANPDDWTIRNNKTFPSTWYMGGRDLVLEFAFPELAGKRQYYDPIVRDLNTKGLLSIESLHLQMTRNGMTQPAVTFWGAELVRLIREPQELR